jgi:predicted acylesterase/phospholipase RssA
MTIATSLDDGPGSRGRLEPFEHACRQQLTEQLAEHYGVHDAADLRALLGSVVWRRVMNGHVLPDAEQGSPRIWMVMLGALRVRRLGQPRRQAPLEDVAPGGLVREDRVPPAAVVATRDTLLAGFPVTELPRLTAANPQLLVTGPASFIRPSDAPGPRATVIAVAVAPGLDRRYVVSRLAAGLEALGGVELLWPARVDVLLSSRGISQSERGESGDLEVARLLGEIERRAVASVVLELGDTPDAWTRRALAAADRVAVVARADDDAGSDDRLRRVVDFAPADLPKHLVLLRRHPGAPTGTGRRLDAIGCEWAHHVTPEVFRDVVRVARVLCGRGRGLVLSGGGARGFAHLGVHRALHELGIEIDLFAGSSIGSPLAVTMADGIAPDDLEPLIERQFARVLDYTVPVVALTSGRRITAATAQVFGDRDIEDLHRGFVCVSTDLTTARPHVHRRGSIVHAIRASCAIPGVMPPVPHEGHLLVDGGVTDNLPVDVLRELTPAGEVIAVDVVPRSGPRAREDYGLWVGGLQALRRRGRQGRTPPQLAATIMRALTVASDQRRNGGSGSSADQQLALDLRGVSMLDFRAVRSVARRGYDQAMPALERWLASRDGVRQGEEDEDVHHDAA